MQLFRHIKYAVLVFIIGIIITFITVSAIERIEQQKIQKTLNQQLSGLTSQLKSELNEQIFLYNWLAKQWLTFGQPDAFLWHQQAKHIIDNHEFLQAVVWIDQGKTIRWIEPLIGNQNAFNLALSKIPFINETLDKAIQTGQVATVANWKLVQGMNGLLIYAPIGQADDHKGFISGVIRQNEFLDNVAKLSLSPGYQFKIDLNNKDIYHFYGDYEDQSHTQVKASIQLFNQTWHFTLWPTQAQLNKIKTTYSSYITWIGLLSTLIFSIIIQLLFSTRSYSRYLNKINRDLEFQIRQREKTEQDLIKTANYDKLTGLPNRSALDKHISHQLKHKNSRYLGVILVDLDRFKDVNDVLGHAAGDKLLSQVTNKLIQLVHPKYYMARIGGDEFAIYIDELASHLVIERLAESILALLDTHFEVDNYQFYTSVSIGFAYANNQQVSAIELIRNADSALNQAKESGKNCICQYTQKLHQDISQRVELAGYLRTALEQNQFQLHYQPKVDSERNICTGFEALIRWQHPKTHQWVNPEQFISVAEETGLIVPLGEWIFEQACAQLKEWHTMGYTELTMAINISGRQIQTNDLFDFIFKTYNKYGLPSTTLELELTEQVFIENIIQHEDFMQKVTHAGLSLSIDDFGVGYSSLSYLKNFPVDTLKIDRSFVKDLPHDFNDVSIVKAITSLAQSLDLTLVAEGVENQQQLDFLNQLGCRYIQGYFYARPLTVEQINQKLLSEDPLFRKSDSFVF